MNCITITRNYVRFKILMTLKSNKFAQTQFLISYRLLYFGLGGFLSRYTGHVANILSAILTMSAFVNVPGPRLNSDSKRTRMETIAMVILWTPCQCQGPVGPSCPALSKPSVVHGRSPQAGSSLLLPLRR